MDHRRLIGGVCGGLSAALGAVSVPLMGAAVYDAITFGMNGTENFHDPGLMFGIGLCIAMVSFFCAFVAVENVRG